MAALALRGLFTLGRIVLPFILRRGAAAAPSAGRAIAGAASRVRPALGAGERQLTQAAFTRGGARTLAQEAELSATPITRTQSLQGFATPEEIARRQLALSTLRTGPTRLIKAPIRPPVLGQRGMEAGRRLQSGERILREGESVTERASGSVVPRVLGTQFGRLSTGKRVGLGAVGAGAVAIPSVLSRRNDPLDTVRDQLNREAPPSGSTSKPEAQKQEEVRRTGVVQPNHHQDSHFKRNIPEVNQHTPNLAALKGAANVTVGQGPGGKAVGPGKSAAEIERKIKQEKRDAEKAERITRALKQFSRV